MQVFEPGLEYVPPGHWAQYAQPSPEYVPAVQIEQLDEPLFLENAPGKHFVQFAELWREYVPSGQLVHSEKYFDENLHAGQIVQNPALPFEYVPAGQTLQIEAPFVENILLGQLLHLGEPITAGNCPTGHKVHKPDPEYSPNLHFKQDEDFPKNMFQLDISHKKNSLVGKLYQLYMDYIG